MEYPRFRSKVPGHNRLLCTLGKLVSDFARRGRTLSDVADDANLQVLCPTGQIRFVKSEVIAGAVPSH